MKLSKTLMKLKKNLFKIEKWNLHKRFALNIIRITGSKKSKVILGFMIATAFLSMWI